MNTSTILVTILTSSVISSALTAFVNWYIQRNNYKNDYYKKLLDKRIEAYEMIVFYIDQMKPIVDHKDGKVCHRFLSSGQELYNSFYASVAVGTGKAFWLSSDVSHLVTQFNIFLHENINNEIQDLENIDQELIRLGIKNKQKISEFRINLEHQVQADFKDLHNIVKFTKGIYDEHTYTIHSSKAQQ